MSSPYYEDEYVTLYHGDCLQVDAWLAADVLVTDPPYGIGWKQGSNITRKSRPHLGIANDGSTDVRDAALELWGLESRAARVGKPAFVFGSFRNGYPAGTVTQILVWKKPIDAGVIGSTTGYRTDTELIFMLGKHPQRSASRSSVLESRCGTRRYNPVANGEGHPHAKPPAILEQLIEWTEGVVADPFSGSGSTLIAARNLGRKAIGVELEERYCEMTASRLAQGALDFGEAS